MLEETTDEAESDVLSSDQHSGPLEDLLIRIVCALVLGAAVYLTLGVERNARIVPFAIAIPALLVACWGLVDWVVHHREAGHPTSPSGTGNAVPIVKAMAMSIATALAVLGFGLVVGVAMLVFAYMLYCREKLLTSMILALCSSATIYLLFTEALKINVPMGWWLG